jgi:hypothetical protein
LIFCLGVGFELVPIFEQYRNEEFAERKKNRKKIDDEEDNNKKANSSNGETEKKKLYDGEYQSRNSSPTDLHQNTFGVLRRDQYGTVLTNNC